MASDVVAGQEHESHRVDVLWLVDAIVYAKGGKLRRANGFTAPNSQKLLFLISMGQEEDNSDRTYRVAYTKKDALTRALFNFLIKSDSNSLLNLAIASNEIQSRTTPTFFVGVRAIIKGHYNLKRIVIKAENT
jgi:hypothetical protein